MQSVKLGIIFVKLLHNEPLNFGGDGNSTHFTPSLEVLRNCCIRVESEDMTGNSRAVLYENKLPVKTTVRLYIQNVLDFVYNFLVTNFPNNHKLWDMKSVRKWGGQPASDAQKRLIYRNRKKLSDLDIDYDTEAITFILLFPSGFDPTHNVRLSKLS